MRADSSKPIYNTDNYAAFVGELTLAPDYRGTVGYRIVNTRTGVCEQETNLEYMAILICEKQEENLQQVLMDPTTDPDMGFTAPSGGNVLN